MKHLEEKQLSSRESSRTSPRRSGMGIRLLALLTVAIGAGAGLSYLIPPQNTDDVSASERQARENAFLSMDELLLQPVVEDDVDAEMRRMRLPPVERESLREQLAADGTPDAAGGAPDPTAAAPSVAKLKLTRLTLWDTHAPDGDVVTVSSVGYQVPVLLTKAMQTITIPSDGTSPVQITGTKDGGGGVTLGIRGASGEFLAPILAEGQSLTIPVAF